MKLLKANIEYRIMNVECRRNVFCLFYKKTTERSETTLRHSAVRYSIFCGSLFKSLKFHTRCRVSGVEIQLLRN
ncbi:hypothetical protein D1AOALGA4SA_4120 [Olavius algarvensis Delta 1 endosymbiont]|nr:hypothetical protein D1AOALGA4SA_4120 [Olavius algarvensis Delta 1 endosymbiont]